MVWVILKTISSLLGILNKIADELLRSKYIKLGVEKERAEEFKELEKEMTEAKVISDKIDTLKEAEVDEILKDPRST